MAPAARPVAAVPFRKLRRDVEWSGGSPRSHSTHMGFLPNCRFTAGGGLPKARATLKHVLALPPSRAIHSAARPPPGTARATTGSRDFPPDQSVGRAGFAPPGRDVPSWM